MLEYQTIKTYEIKYKYEDELKEKGWRNSLIVVYDSSNNTEGATFDHALNLASEDGDYSGVDKLLAPLGVNDEDIVFYFDRAGIEDESLVLELQHDFDIVINDIAEVHL